MAGRHNLGKRGNVFNTTMHSDDQREYANNSLHIYHMNKVTKHTSTNSHTLQT